MYERVLFGAIISTHAIRSLVWLIVMGVSTRTASVSEYIKVQDIGDQVWPLSTLLMKSTQGTGGAT